MKTGNIGTLHQFKNTPTDINTKITISGVSVTDRNVAPIYCCCQFVPQSPENETFTKDIYDFRSLNKSIRNVKSKFRTKASTAEVNAGTDDEKYVTPKSFYRP